MEEKIEKVRRKMKKCEEILGCSIGYDSDFDYHNPEECFLRTKLLLLLTEKSGLCGCMEEGALLKGLVEDENISYVMISLFDYLLSFGTFEYLQFNGCYVDIVDMFMCRYGSTMKEKDIENVIQKMCQMDDWEWIDKDDEELNIEQKMIKEILLKFLEQEECTFLWNKKYIPFLRDSIMSEDEDYRDVNVLRCEILPELIEKQIIDKDFLDPYFTPLLFFIDRDAEHEEDGSVVVWETGYSPYIGGEPLYLNHFNSFFFISMYYIELGKKYYQLMEKRQ